MNAIATGIAGALISGVAMYTVGAKATPLDAFTAKPGVGPDRGRAVVPANTTALQPAATQTVTTTPINNVSVTRRRTVYRRAAERSES